MYTNQNFPKAHFAGNNKDMVHRDPSETELLYKLYVEILQYSLLSETWYEYIIN